MPSHLHYHSLPSTSDLAKQLGRLTGGHVFPAGLCITADVQTAGRGQFERMWVSPPGGVYFSFLSFSPASSRLSREEAKEMKGLRPFDPPEKDVDCQGAVDALARMNSFKSALDVVHALRLAVAAVVAEHQPCGWCGRMAMHRAKFCGRCKMVWYCNEECQRQAWPEHKTHCHKKPAAPVAAPDIDAVSAAAK